MEQCKPFPDLADLSNISVVYKKISPRKYQGLWVTEGARTLDPQNHNLML